MTPTPAPRFGRTSPTANQKGRTYLVTTGLFPVIIATVHVDAGDVADELVRLANTAPDLLAACKAALAALTAYDGLVTHIENPRGWSDVDGYAAYLHLHAAIAKAEGTP